MWPRSSNAHQAWTKECKREPGSKPNNRLIVWKLIRRRNPICKSLQEGCCSRSSTSSAGENQRYKMMHALAHVLVDHICSLSLSLSPSSPPLPPSLSHSPSLSLSLHLSHSLSSLVYCTAQKEKKTDRKTKGNAREKQYVRDKNWQENKGERTSKAQDTTGW